MKILPTLSILVATSVTLLAGTYTWDGPSSGSNWSTGVNWTTDPAGGPGAGDTAILGDVASGTRTIVYDSSASGSLGTLQVDQTTSGGINLLSIGRNLTIANGFTLSASTGGISRILVQSGASGLNTLNVGGSGITLGTNGQLTLDATDNTNKSAYTGNLTIAGGTLTLSRTTGSAQTTNVITGALTMTSGFLTIDNPFGGFVGDRRLQVTGNLNITGGTVSTTRAGTAGILVLDGSSLVYNPTTGDNDLAVTLNAFGDQSLSTNQTLAAGLQLRGRGVKTVTSTHASNTINALTFIDGDSNAAVGTTLKLGSNLNLASAAAQPAAAGFGDVGASSLYGIDTNGYTLNLTSGAGSGVWTPNKSALPTIWNLSGSGVIAANAFNFNTADVTTNVAAGTTLEARGGNASVNDLGGTGTFNAASTFRYAGTATSANPATLTSNRAIGNLEVSGGALKLLSANGIQGATTVSDGTLILAATASLGGTSSVTLGASGTLDTTLQTTFVMLSNQPFIFTIDPTGNGLAGQINAAGLDITSASVNFASLGTWNDVYIIASYTSLTGVAFGEINGLQSGYSIDYNYLGTNQIALVPEPTTAALLVLGLTLILRRRRA